MKFLTNLRRHAAARPLLLILALLVVGLGYSVVSPQRSSAETEMTQQIEEGKALFDFTCSSCHGLNGEGTSQGPSLVGVGAASVDFQMGTGRMPAAREQAQLPARQVNYSQEQIEAVAAYVATLGAGPAIPTEDQYSPEGLTEEEIARGGALFRANCSACHGIVGGGGAMPNGKYAPSLVETAPVHIYEAMRTGPQQMPDVLQGRHAGPERPRDHRLPRRGQLAAQLRRPHHGRRRARLRRLLGLRDRHRRPRHRRHLDR